MGVGRGVGPAPWWVGAGLAAIFLTVAAVRRYPFVDDISLEGDAGNDWLVYKLQALSILHEGLRARTRG